MKRALLVIDVQNEYFTGKLPVTYPLGSLDNILKAMDAAAAHQMPRIVIQHTNGEVEAKTFVPQTDGWQIHPLVAAKPGNQVMEKTYPGSFTGTGLDVLLKKAGIDTVVICGYMTQMCCDTTARQAAHLDYQVEFLSDATGTLDFANYAGSVSAEQLHKTILVVQAMRFSKVMTTQEWIGALG